jgi:flagellin-like hook-associated protein FlgL
MATLNSSNVVNGNIVESTDILQLYDAFTAGGGTTGVYDVTVSGSLIGNASTATSASYAITASHALNAGSGTVTQINDQAYSNQGAESEEVNFKFLAGTVI